MIITRKCMLTALLALGMLGGGTAFAQRSDFNSVSYAESFESLIAWQNVYTNVNITNGWYSGPNDLSVITNTGDYGFTACSYPLAGASHTNALMLSTEDTILTNSFGNGYNMSAISEGGNGLTYVDFMVKFVASEDTPSALRTTSDPQELVKLAIYANATTNLIIYHSVLDPSDASVLSNALEDVGIPLLATNWYRLTITFDATETLGGASLEMFQVQLNGTTITNANAYLDTWRSDFNNSIVPLPSSTGTWWPSTARDSATRKKLTALCFQGTGYIDDLVVTNGAPSYSLGGLGGPWMVTVVTGNNGTSKTNGVDLASPLATFYVANGGSTSIVYTANDWYRINSLTKNGSAVTEANNLKAYTQDLVSVSAPISNNVTFYQIAASNYNASCTNVTTDWLASWGSETNVLHPNTLTTYQLYLLGVNPFVTNSADFRVTDIAVTAGTNIAVTVGLQINSGNHTNINGTLSLLSNSNLTLSTWTQVGGTPVTGEAFTNGVHTYYFVDTVSNNFYQAVIEPTP